MARGVWFVEPGHVEVRDVDVPEPGPGEVRVRTHLSGISAGTEALAFRGEIDAGLALDDSLSGLDGTFTYPFRYGYSCVGEVETGSGELPAGTSVFAFHPHQDVFTAPVRDAVPVEGIDPRLATMFPLVETALQISLDAGPVAEEVVPVIGLGSVGLLTSMMLARAGARVIASEPLAWRREVASSLGISAVEPAELRDEVLAATRAGAPLVVEVSGSPEAASSALSLLAPEGTLLVASWYGSREVPLPLGREFHRRRLVIRSSQVSTIPSTLAERWDVPRRRAVARRLLEELPLKPLATHEFPLEDAPAAFRAVAEDTPGLIHAALRHR